MADLNEIQSSQAVKLADGTEANYLGVDSLLRANTKDVVISSGRNLALSVGTTPVIARAHASSDLTNRVLLVIYNPNATIVYWTFTNSASAGIPIEKGEIARFKVAPGVPVYLYTASGTTSVNIAEGA